MIWGLEQRRPRYGLLPNEFFGRPAAWHSFMATLGDILPFVMVFRYFCFNKNLVFVRSREIVLVLLCRISWGLFTLYSCKLLLAACVLNALVCTYSSLEHLELNSAKLLLP